MAELSKKLGRSQTVIHLLVLGYLSRGIRLTYTDRAL